MKFIKKRITQADLKREVKGLNRKLVESGSNVFFNVASRCGLTVLELRFMDDIGRERKQTDLACSSAIVCLGVLHDVFVDNFGRIHHGSKITRKTAKALLAKHIRLDSEPGDLNTWGIELLEKWAKLTDYKKPGPKKSMYIAFLRHLENKVDLE